MNEPSTAPRASGDASGGLSQLQSLVLSMLSRELPQHEYLIQSAIDGGGAGITKYRPLANVVEDVLNQLLDRGVVEYVPMQGWRIAGPCKQPQQKVDRLFRSLALLSHPDHGGSVKAMALANQLREELHRIER